MADTFSKSKRSEIMSAIRSKDTKIEVAFRRELWKEGYRYRKYPKNYFGKPDIVLKKYKTVIFIDSCFWHGCEQHCRMPLSSRDYWIKKIQRNKERDKEVNKYYKKISWKIIRIWEHEINEDLYKSVHKIIVAIGHQ